MVWCEKVPVLSPTNALSFTFGEQITWCLQSILAQFLARDIFFLSLFACQVMGVLVLIFLLSCVCLFGSLHVASGY